jgi:hypothetical protein
MTESDITRALRLERLAEQCQRDLDAVKQDIHRMQAQCDHNWSDPVYDPIVTGGYTSPGDPIGTMGVDWRGPRYVPRSEPPRWTRACSKCRKMEVTCATTESVTRMPKFE